MSASESELSEIEISQSSPIKLADLKDSTQKNWKPALKNIKRKNKNIKTVIVKGKEHKSSTAPEQGEVVSVQCRDDKNNYMGSFHLDTNGNTYTNSQFDKSVAKSRK